MNLTKETVRRGLLLALILGAVLLLVGHYLVLPWQRARQPLPPQPDRTPPALEAEPPVKASPAPAVDVTPAPGKVSSDKVTPKFSTKDLYNKVRDELAEHHPLLFDADKRLAWVQRWTLSDASFALI